jgi:hypothetical protein
MGTSVAALLLPSPKLMVADRLEGLLDAPASSKTIPTSPEKPCPAVAYMVSGLPTSSGGAEA